MLITIFLAWERCNTIFSIMKGGWWGCYENILFLFRGQKWNLSFFIIFKILTNVAMILVLEGPYLLIQTFEYVLKEMKLNFIYTTNKRRFNVCLIFLVWNFIPGHDEHQWIIQSQWGTFISQIYKLQWRGGAVSYSLGWIWWY